jgi:hypothetical protein
MARKLKKEPISRFLFQPLLISLQIQFFFLQQSYDI